MLNTMKRLDNLRRLVEEQYTSLGPDADPWTKWAYPNHVLVVAEHAEELAKTHEASIELAVAGALLHDIADSVMPRKDAAHEMRSYEIAQDLLEKAGFMPNEIEEIIEKIIKTHSCHVVMPVTTEAKIVASADAMAHLLTDFYLYFCWQHYGTLDEEESFDSYRQWLLMRIEKDFHTKIFFDDARRQVKKRYDALKLLFAA